MARQPARTATGHRGGDPRRAGLLHPRLELGSELILALVIPPLLYSATRATPSSGFSANLDTITTVSHGRELGLPRRATQILTGESLVDDATALTLRELVEDVDLRQAAAGREKS